MGNPRVKRDHEIMQNHPLQIAIAAGGDSSEYPISIKSAKNVLQHIDSSRFDARIVEIRGQDWTVWNHDGTRFGLNKHDFSWAPNGTPQYFDAVFNSIHGSPGENGILQAYFDLIRMPYTGCRSFASSLTFNKYYCNQFLKQSGIKVAPSLFLRSLDPDTTDLIVKEIGLPCIVKPNSGGSSCGASRVNSRNEIIPALETAFNEDREVLVEKLLEGTEVTCGVCITPNQKIIFPLTEVISKKEFFDFEAKYDPALSEEITPARIPDKIARSVADLSTTIYTLLGCLGIVRMDYIIVNQQPFFLEVNTIPGLTSESIVPKQAAMGGLSMPMLISLLLDEALAR